MNKLISNNPIQKFKQGRKIIKAQHGEWLAKPDGTITQDITGAKNWRILNSPEQIYKMAYYDQNGVKKYGRLGFFGNKKGYFNLETGRPVSWNNAQKIVRYYNNKPVTTTPTTENPFNPSGTVYPDGAYFEEKRPNGQVIKGRWQGGKKVYWTTPTTENPFNVTVTPKTPTPTYYATRAYRNSLNIDRLGLKSRADVLAYQKELNKLGANIKEDGIWGDNTNAAYLKYKGFKPGNDEILIPTTSVTTSTNSIGGTDIKDINNIHPEKLDVEYSYNYNPVYNRSMTRDWITQNLKINPYNVSGAQRRALRYWLNGDKEGQNYDKNILGVFGDLTRFAKQGGTLISKNPIKRFQQGRTLPTAPRAEDRYRNSRRDSVAYLTLTPDELGRSIKRVTTPNNAKIQREIIFNRGTQNNDTIYTEIPEHDKWKLFPIKTNIKPRKGFSFAQTPEYEILKRRFNTAWNLAK